MSLRQRWTPPQKHVYRSADEAWRETISDVIRAGHEVRPRDLRTLELLGVMRSFDMRYPVVISRGRRLGYRFMPAEAAWILSGSDKVEPIAKYSKHVRNFSDDGITFFGAYGPRVTHQLPYVIETLSVDTSSRQAVMNIWREVPPYTRDVPCTLSLQFLVREGQLHTFVTMRSSDTWLGWPYDVFTFAMVSTAVMIGIREATDERLQPGTLTMTCGSQHLYEKDWVHANACLSAKNSEPLFTYSALDPHVWPTIADLRKSLWALAEKDEHLKPLWLGELLGVRGVGERT